MTRYLSEEEPTGNPTISPEEALRALRNKFPRNHGITQHRRIIASAFEELVFPQYWERYGLPTDSAELSARRAWNFGILQTQRLYLPVVQENERLRIEITKLKARLDTNRAQVKAMAEEKQNVCYVANHVYVDDKCAECGQPKRRRTKREPDGAKAAKK